jgi:hypothetical protein
MLVPGTTIFIFFVPMQISAQKTAAFPSELTNIELQVFSLTLPLPPCVSPASRESNGGDWQG